MAVPYELLTNRPAHLAGEGPALGGHPLTGGEAAQVQEDRAHHPGEEAGVTSNQQLECIFWCPERHLVPGGRSAIPGEGHIERSETSCWARAHVRPSTAEPSLGREEEEASTYHLETMSQPSLARNTSRIPRSVDIRILM